MDSAAAAISVSFPTERTDFPPNLTDLRIERIALYFPHAADQLFTVTVDDLTFKPRGGAAIAGGPASSDQSGLISSSTATNSWRQFSTAATSVGQWTLTLPNTAQVRDRFRNGNIDNVLFVVTYSGATPPFPA